METNTVTADQPEPERYWYQFSRRTLLVFVVLASVAVGLAMKVERAWQQQVAVEAIKRAGGVIHSVPDDGFFSTVIGVWGHMRPDPKLDEHEVQRLKNMLPQQNSWVKFGSGRSPSVWYRAISMVS